MGSLGPQSIAKKIGIKEAQIYIVAQFNLLHHVALQQFQIKSIINLTASSISIRHVFPSRILYP